MSPQLLEILSGRRHQFAALVLYRGDTFIETVDDGGMAIYVFFSGNASISRTRRGEQVGLHITPGLGLPVVLRHPGTYCVVARDHTVGVRLLRTGESA